jgi:hypothetical protein
MRSRAPAARLGLHRIGIPWSVAMTWLKIHWIPGYQLPL